MFCKTRGRWKNTFWMVFEHFLKTNSEKCHLTLSTNEPFSINMGLLKIVTRKKLLRVNLNNRLDFDTHATNTCNRVRKKSSCLRKNFLILKHS